MRVVDEIVREAELARERGLVESRNDKHSWTPIDLVRYADTPPEPATISGLVYPGKRHVFSGEPETLKTWAALVMCVEQIKSGRDSVWVDFEMDAREHAARLRALGLSDEQIRDHFFYVHPSEPLPPVLASFEMMISHVQPALVVFDAFTGALALHGADENSNTDVERFYTSVVSPIQAQGAAVVLLDHVTKNRETRGRYSIGGGRKLGACDVHLGFDVVRRFGRGKSGLAKILTHKDRPGYLAQPKAAELELVANEDGSTVSWQWRVPADEETAHRFRPTVLMERVSMYVIACVDPPSRNAVEQAVSGKAEYVRDAISVLVQDGYLVEEDGPRNARVLRSIEPFRDNQEAA